MAESSSHNPSSPKITPKEELVTLDKPESPNPFLPIDQIEFIFEDIAFTTNNEVTLLYPLHPNSEYFWERGVLGRPSDTKICVSPQRRYGGEIGAKGNSKRVVFLLVHVDSKAPNLPHKLRRFPKAKSLELKVDFRRKQSSKHTSESKTKASKSKTGQSEKET
ncbi:hypothetical protein Tco_0150254 [Tanacetum coccineum]